MRMRWVTIRTFPRNAECSEQRNHRRLHPAFCHSALVDHAARKIVAEAHLRARLNDMDRTADDRSFDVLGRAEQALHFHADAGDRAQQFVAKLRVPTSFSWR